MDIQPIKSEADLDRAFAAIDELWGAAEGSEEGDRLEVLVTLVEAYENTHHPIYPPDPVSAILFRMEQAGLSRADLEPFIGTRARVSEVLNGRRGLSIEMIRKLNENLGIPLESLVGVTQASKAS